MGLTKVLAALTLAGGALFYASAGPRDTPVVQARVDEETQVEAVEEKLKFDFLRNDQLRWSNVDPNIVREHFSQIGEPYSLGKEDILPIVLQRLESGIEKYVLENVDPNGGRVKSHLTVEEYVAPVSTVCAEQMEAYCNEALELLKEELEDFEGLEARFAHAEQGSKVRSGYNEEFILGSGIYRLYVVNLFSEDGRPSNELILSDFLASSRITYSPNSDDDWYSVLAVGPNSLSAFYAEATVIPLRGLTDEWAEREDVSKEERNAALEGITEALSYHLTQKLIERLGVPRGQEILDWSFDLMIGDKKSQDNLEQKSPDLIDKKRYKLVRRSIGWVEEVGIQKAYETFKNNPNDYIEAIGER